METTTTQQLADSKNERVGKRVNLFWSSVLIATFLILQSYSPIRYYYFYYLADEFPFGKELPNSKLAFDERWSWRMFSPVRQLCRCEVLFNFPNGTLIPIRTGIFAELKFFFLFFRHCDNNAFLLEYKQSWLDLMSFCREEVIEAVSQDLCQRLEERGVMNPAVVFRKIFFLENRFKPKEKKLWEKPTENICQPKS